MLTSPNKCKICKKSIKGRADKRYCSIACKSYYHRRLRAVTSDATSDTIAILQRNRSILLEILGKSRSYRKIHRSALDKKKFNFQYVTQYHLNSRNKMVNYIFDFSWVVFSDLEVLVRRINK